MSEFYEYEAPSRTRIGRRVRHYRSVESTNPLAAESVCDGLAVVTDEQTAGRGQYGRSWIAPAGSSVLTSIYIEPPPPLRQPAILTAWAAVSVCEVVLLLTRRQAKIKWPNDVLLHGKKICGILIEQGRGVVVGVGLNLNQTAEEFQLASLPLAGSIRSIDGLTRSHRAVGELLLDELDREYERLQSGDTSTLEACWKWRLGLLGRQVAAQCHDGTIHRGRLQESAFDRVEIIEAGGRLVQINPSSIKSLGEEIV